MSTEPVTQDGRVAENNDIVSKVASTSNLKQLIRAVPSGYRAKLKDYLVEKHHIYRLHARVQRTIWAYEQHANEGSLPFCVSSVLNEPTLEFTPEFLRSTDGYAAVEAFERQVAAGRRNVLNTAIQQKKAELGYLAARLGPDATKWERLISEAFEGILENCEDPSILPVQGSPDLAETLDPAVEEFNMMSKSCALFTYRAHALTHADAGHPRIREHEQPPLMNPGPVKAEEREHGRTIHNVAQKKSSRRRRNSRSRATSTKNTTMRCPSTGIAHLPVPGRWREEKGRIQKREKKTYGQRARLEQSELAQVINHGGLQDQGICSYNYSIVFISAGCKMTINYALVR
ncbi:hypothetical protein FALBO_16542 [Fusarium albosuccineum]|uniref:Uncharacterized protein n=1 Tax=Fusarium albosuccineum TaxID=1237068 RepID=A0A8H4KGQ4_9HYPO|nr:hypothetical protein FALBO_16542 [Fusarium albosuccineum]